MSWLNTFLRLLVPATIAVIVSSCAGSPPKGIFISELNQGWFIQRSDSVPETGQKISRPGFRVTGWYPASIPSTVMHTLVEQGVYENIFVNDNMKLISPKPFKPAWWYRTEFMLDEIPGALLLHFEGINYKADVWLNGEKIADTVEVKNAFRQFKFDISNQVQKGKNVLALLVFPPQAGDFSIGFVDWNPPPPDANMGLFRRVYLEANKGTGIFNPYVVSELNEDLSEAALTASVEIKNYLKTDFSGEVDMIFKDKKISKPVELKSGETVKIVFKPKDFNELTIKNPKLWWPHTLGEPYLHHAKFVLVDKQQKMLDEKTLTFGIRSVSDYFTRDGHRGFRINGEKILVRGGGWVDRLLLDDTPESIKNQLEYVRDMNLNTIRLEGFWGKDQTLYRLCDEMGILIMAGWSCHWEWEDYLGKPCSEKYGGILSPSDVDMMSKAWRDQIVWLRKHPAIFCWVGGSDCIPKPELEQNYLDIFTQYDSTRVYLASAKEWSTPLGPTGVKMRGPYAYVPPVYWYSDTLYGGAFGFNTETGPGAQVPPLESIRKMITKNHLWPIDSIWDYHCGRNEFNTLSRYSQALEARYGKTTTVDDYTKKAQLLNYELMRPMFEAFSAYRYNATGVIQWMLNSAWPEMYWQLYDYYLMPNGAYYGAKKASQPYHAIYDYAHHSVFVVNDKLEDKNNCVLKIRAYNLASDLKYEKEIKVNLKANSSLEILKLPDMEWVESVYFLDMRLLDKNENEIDNNFYCLSQKKDVLDYGAEVPGWYHHTPSKQYADFTALNSLPKAKVSSSIKETTTENHIEFLVELKNNSSKLAFFVHLQIVDKETGNTILPVLWTDNYVSLLAGESRKLTARINKKYLKNKTPHLIVEGYN